MRSTYTLEPLSPADAERWEQLISPYPGCELFHHRPWLAYLAASQKVEIRMWVIREHGRTVGYFCGGLDRKGPFTVLGSPMKGWGTNFMGPIADAGFDDAAFLSALDELARDERLAMIELEYRGQDAVALMSAGYEPVLGSTYVVPISAAEDKMWTALHKNARNPVRKAIKSGLSAQDGNDPMLADEYYEEYSALLMRKGLAPPYSKTCPRLLLQHLKPPDSLFALRVRDENGRTLATGLFPHDSQRLYFWGGASWNDGRDLCPNDFLHWSAMCMAAQRGLTSYDMSGYGKFKKKFGGTLVTLKRWHKYYWRSARWARSGYRVYRETRQHCLGWWRRTAANAAAGRAGHALSFSR